MPRTRHTTMQPVQRMDDIPDLASEEDEDTYWSTHELGEGILDQMGPIPEDELPPARERTRPIAIRFDEDVLRRLKALAARKRKGYQSLLKEFVVERLYEEEKREGVFGAKP